MHSCCTRRFYLLCSISVAAQQARGTLRGLFTDEFGAAIVGASVTLTDADRRPEKGDHQW
jgi:hypothetical protein